MHCAVSGDIDVSVFLCVFKGRNSLFHESLDFNVVFCLTFPPGLQFYWASWTNLRSINVGSDWVVHTIACGP